MIEILWLDERYENLTSLGRGLGVLDWVPSRNGWLQVHRISLLRYVQVGAILFVYDTASDVVVRIVPNKFLVNIIDVEYEGWQRLILHIVNLDLQDLVEHGIAVVLNDIRIDDGSFHSLGVPLVFVNRAVGDYERVAGAILVCRG